MRLRILLLITLLAMTAVSGISAGDLQQKTVRDLKGNPITIYFYNGQRYSLLEHEELSRAKAGVHVCVLARLSEVRDDAVLLHDQSLIDVRFVLKDGVQVKAKPGANLWIGGQLKRENGQTTFLVEATSPLASDLDLFKTMWNDLEKRKTATPEDYLRLGWQLDRGRVLSMGLSNEEYKAYRDGTEKAYARALSLEQQGLDSRDSKDLAARVTRYRDFVKSFGGSTVGERTRWQLDQYRKILHDNARAVESLTAETGAAPLEKEQIDRLLADLHLMVGQMAIQYLKDEDLAGRIFREGAKIRPADVDLGKELKQLGYVRYKDQWATPDEVTSLRRKERDEARAEETRIARLKEEEARKQALQRLQAGEGLRKIRTTVDPLLTNPSTENLAELAELLPSLSEDVARYALWQADALPPAIDTQPLLKSALLLESDQVRKDAGALLARKGTSDAMTAVVGRLRLEKDAAVRDSLIQAIERVPGTEGIDGLVVLVSTNNAPESARKKAAEILQRETGESHGMNAQAWKDWWQKNRTTFTRNSR